MHDMRILTISLLAAIILLNESSFGRPTDDLFLTDASPTDDLFLTDSSTHGADYHQQAARHEDDMLNEEDYEEYEHLDDYSVPDEMFHHVESQRSGSTLQDKAESGFNRTSTNLPQSSTQSSVDPVGTGITAAGQNNEELREGDNKDELKRNIQANKRLSGGVTQLVPDTLTTDSFNPEHRHEISELHPLESSAAVTQYNHSGDSKQDEQFVRVQGSFAPDERELALSRTSKCLTLLTSDPPNVSVGSSHKSPTNDNHRGQDAEGSDPLKLCDTNSQEVHPQFVQHTQNNNPEQVDSTRGTDAIPKTEDDSYARIDLIHLDQSDQTAQNAQNHRRNDHVSNITRPNFRHRDFNVVISDGILNLPPNTELHVGLLFKPGSNHVDATLPETDDENHQLDEILVTDKQEKQHIFNGTKFRESTEHNYTDILAQADLYNTSSSLRLVLSPSSSYPGIKLSRAVASLSTLTTWAASTLTPTSSFQSEDFFGQGEISNELTTITKVQEMSVSKLLNIHLSPTNVVSEITDTHLSSSNDVPGDAYTHLSSTNIVSADAGTHLSPSNVVPEDTAIPRLPTKQSLELKFSMNQELNLNLEQTLQTSPHESTVSTPVQINVTESAPILSSQFILSSQPLVTVSSSHSRDTKQIMRDHFEKHSYLASTSFILSPTSPVLETVTLSDVVMIQSATATSVPEQSFSTSSNTSFTKSNNNNQYAGTNNSPMYLNPFADRDQQMITSSIQHYSQPDRQMITSTTQDYTGIQINPTAVINEITNTGDSQVTDDRHSPVNETHSKGIDDDKENVQSDTTRHASHTSSSGTTSSTDPRMPSSFMELQLNMSWQEFCQNEQSIRESLAATVQQNNDQLDITPDQIRLVTSDREQCDKLQIMETRVISVRMYLMDSDLQFDRHLTLTCARTLVSTLSFGVISVFTEKLLAVGIHDEENFERVTAATVVEEENSRNAMSDPGVTIAVVMAAVGGCYCIGLLVLQIIVRRGKGSTIIPQFSQSYSATSSDSIQLSPVAKSRPNSAIFNFGLDLINQLELSNPLNFVQLSLLCMDDNKISQEYQKIPQRMPRLSVVPEGDEDKNRYANVLPLAHTRVKLHVGGPEPASTYINANYVTGPNNHHQYYIATQAPTEKTVPDFWAMIWQQRTKAIIMLTQLEEDGQVKCASYWPELFGKSAVHRHGDFLIELKHKDVHQEYIASLLEVNNLREIETREIYHFWYTCWPAVGVPEPISLVKLVLDTRPKYEGFNSPLVVHCSPGTGRTCTFIALDLCMHQFETSHVVDVMRTVHNLRQERAGAVQNKEQYTLLYNAVHEYANIVVSPVISAASSATTLLLPS